MVYKKTSKNIKQFVCIKCDFECSKKGDYNRHLKTKKHNGINGISNGIKKVQFSCECGKLRSKSTTIHFIRRYAYILLYSKIHAFI